MRLPSHSRARAGFTFIELAVVMVILLVSLLIFSSTVSGMAQQRAVTRESALAMTAARNMMETLRSENFSQVLALYNSNPDDDPGGPGTAPGNRFDVPDLREAADALDGLEGEIFFPLVDDPVDGLQLREDMVDRNLGMPRDLNGDSIIDDQDHSGAYFILPVQIRIRWIGKNGLRQYQIASQLTRWKKS